MLGKRHASRSAAGPRWFFAIVAVFLAASLTTPLGLRAGDGPARLNTPSTAYVGLRRVLIAGGCCDKNGQPLNAAEIYGPDPSKPPFRFVFLATGNMTDARIGHTATLLPNGKVLIAGGSDGLSSAVSSAELYDPLTGQFSPTGSMAVTRTAHTATLLEDGLVLVCGGHDASDNTLASAELYDPTAGAFSVAGEMVASRAFHTASMLTSGKLSGWVLIAGGAGAGNTVLDTAELYDPSSGEFTATGPMMTARAAHTATVLPNGEALLAGGASVAPPVIAGTTKTAELYNPATGRFTAILPNPFSGGNGKMSIAREEHAAVALPMLGGMVLISGGIACAASEAACATLPISISNTAEFYDPLSRSFVSAGRMIAPRAQHTATLLSFPLAGMVLLAGGLGASSLNSAELYNQTTRKFLPASSMINPRYGHTATLLPPPPCQLICKGCC